MKKKTSFTLPDIKIFLVPLVTLLFFTASIAFVMAKRDGASTQVPGHLRYDEDGNGIPDIGREVNGHYTSVYAYDASGKYYWDLGDGRFYGVPSPDDLDQSTLTTCEYVVNYRGKFENTPYMDSGWIQNHITCGGYDDNGTYNYDIVHKTDPRYTGNPDFAIWGDWEYKTLTESKEGNLVQPYKHQGN